MARGMWGETKTFTFEPIPAVDVVGYHQPSHPAGYQATVTLVCQKNELQPQKPARYAVLSVPGGGLNRWTAAELREYAAALTEAANQLDDAGAWLGA